jgi:hypothetical protein
MRPTLCDSEKLVYSPDFWAEDENSWQTIRSHMFENTLLLGPDVCRWALFLSGGGVGCAFECAAVC